MKYVAVLVLLATCPAFAQQWENCSEAQMTPVSTNGGCAPATPPLRKYMTVPATMTFTWDDKCASDGGQNVYFEKISPVTGVGQCQLVALPTTWAECDPINEVQATNATSQGDFNRMYNRVYDTYLAGASSKTTGVCQKIGTQRQDFQQCIPQACDPCLEGPPFACCGGENPTCTNGTWSCGGDCSCNFTDPMPINCNVGQNVQCTSGGWQCEDNPGTPIIIDTDGTGFQLTSGANGVMFDLNADGKKTKISWTVAGSKNGWLALPLADGSISTGKQLFGNFTPQPASDHPNGFLALAVYDQLDHGGNGDGVIDWHDAIWSKLRVWIDANHDGIAQRTELNTLPSLGIQSLGLKYVETPVTDRYGNKFRYKGKVNPLGQPPNDLVDRVMYDVFLVPGNTPSRVKGNCNGAKPKTLPTLAPTTQTLLRDRLN